MALVGDEDTLRGDWRSLCDDCGHWLIVVFGLVVVVSLWLTPLMVELVW